jgi:hypothetical protein
VLVRLRQRRVGLVIHLSPVNAASQPRSLKRNWAKLIECGKLIDEYIYMIDEWRDAFDKL